MKIFAIMPHYSDPDFSEKQAVIIDAARQCGVEAVFGSNEGSEQAVNKSIRLLESTESVLADLSLERPSCYFEVGFAQSQGKSVYLIAKTGTEIHQVRGKTTVKFYKTLHDYENVIRSFFERFSEQQRK